MLTKGQRYEPPLFPTTHPRGKRTTPPALLFRDNSHLNALIVRSIFIQDLFGSGSRRKIRRHFDFETGGDEINPRFAESKTRNEIAVSTEGTILVTSGKQSARPLF